MIVTTSPATIFDLAELANAQTRVQWGIARELHAKGEFFAFRLGEQLLAMGGFYPLNGGLDAEAYFNHGPEAHRHMLGMIRATRLTIDRSPYRAIVTACTTEAGKRIAALAGFTYQAESELGEVWAYGRPIDRKSGEGRPDGAAELRPGGAADQPRPDGGAAGRPRPGDRRAG